MRTKSNARTAAGKRTGSKKTTPVSRTRSKGSLNSAEEQTGRTAGSKSKSSASAKSKSSRPASSKGQSGREEGFISRLATRVGLTDEPQDGLMKMMQAMLQDIYWAEKHLVKSLPELIEAAHSDQLIDALENHLEETEEQVVRLEEVFHLLDLRPKAKKCEAMESLVEEANEVISDFEEGPVRDAAIIIASQKVEHYEIASYGSLRAIADLLQMDEVVDLLQETLDEEGDADKILNEIAYDINEEAYRETYV